MASGRGGGQEALGSSIWPDMDAGWLVWMVPMVPMAHCNLGNTHFQCHWCGCHNYPSVLSIKAKTECTGETQAHMHENFDMEPMKVELSRPLVTTQGEGAHPGQGVQRNALGSFDGGWLSSNQQIGANGDTELGGAYWVP